MFPFKGDTVMNKSIQEFLSAIEKNRRTKDYGRMEDEADQLIDKLRGNDSSDAWAAHSKMTYELHMAAYQQAMALLQKSLDLAEQSATEARKAGDAVGALFTQMNASGLL